MASNRKRSNSSIGNKINRIDSKVARTEKSTQGPHLDPEGISSEHLGTESVSERTIAARAITEDKLARGAVGTEHLGVVNELTSDSNLAFNAGPGYIILNGQQYATTPPSGDLYTVAIDSNGQLVIAPLAPGESSEGSTSTFRRSLPPTGLTASSVGVWTATGDPSSVLMLDWDAVTTGVDGQPITATMYEVFYREEGTAEGNSQLLVSTAATEVNVAPILVDKTYYVKVRAFSSEGAWSNFSSEASVQTVSPVPNLGMPSTPIVGAQPGVVTVSWDGLLGGNTPPAHFSHVYAAMATSVDGTYAPIGQSLVSNGSVSISGLPDGAVRWFRLYAMDRRGAISNASAAASVTVIGAASSSVIEGLVEDMLEQAEEIESVRTAANGKNKIYRQPGTPPGTAYSVGDTWFDSDDGGKMYNWDGAAWQPIQFGSSAIDDTITDAIADAQTAAAGAVSAANGKNKVWFQPAEPPLTGNSIGDTWFDTDNGNKIYSWSGSAWVAQLINTGALASVIVSDISTAKTNASTALTNAATADSKAVTAQGAADTAAQAAAAASGLAAGKGKVLVQSTAPDAADRNAVTLWIDTTGGLNTPKRWTTGTTWVAVTDKVATDAAAAAVTAKGIADQAVLDASAAATAASNAAIAAGNAQTTANNKNTVWYQTSAPPLTGNKTNDVWFDTDDGNKMYRWNGAWTAQTLGVGALDTAVNTSITTAGANAAAAQAAAATAQAAADAAKAGADSRGRVYSQATAPDAGTRYAWTGTPNNSPSTRTDAFGVVKTNLAPNPSYELAGTNLNVRTNEATNPSLLTGTTNWASQWFGNAGAGTTTRTAAVGVNGEWGYLKTWTTAPTSQEDSGFSYRQAAVAGNTYSLSMYVASNIAQSVQLRIIFQDSASATIGSTIFSSYVTLVPNTQTRLEQANLVAPTGTAFVRVLVYVASAANGGVNWTPGDTLVGSGVQIEQGPKVNQYFNGATAPYGDYTHSWAGTAGASASTQHARSLPSTSIANTGLNTCAIYQSADWKIHGNYSLRITPQGTSTDTAANVVGGSAAGQFGGLEPGKTYTASVVFRQTAPQTGSIYKWARSLFMTDSVRAWTTGQVFTQATNTAGEQRLTIQFTVSPGATWAIMRLYSGVSRGNGDVWFDKFMVVEGAVDESYFDGDSQDEHLYDYWVNTTGGLNKPNVWDSTTNAWVPATDKVASDAAIAAATAQTKADQAFADAAAAATAAGTAQTAANGKNRVWYQNDAPAGIGHAVGDTWFDTDDSNRIYQWNGTIWSGLSFGSNAISDLAINANKLANNAVDSTKLAAAVNTAISTAQSDASSAITAANGKNKIIFSTSDASGTTGYVAGDLWFKKSGALIVAQWEFTTSWQARTLDNAVIANLDAGKLTAGTIDAQRIGAKTIFTNKIAIGDYTDFVPDPAFTNSSNSNTISPWPTFKLATDAGVPAGAPTPTVALLTQTFDILTDVNSAFTVQPGEKYYISIIAANSNVGAANFQIGIWFHDATLTYSGATSATRSITMQATPNGLWQTISGEITVPATATNGNPIAYARLWLRPGNSAGWHVTQWHARRKTGGELIVDGAITTNSLAADAVTAAKLAVGAITASKAVIADGAIQRAQIADLAVDNAKIANLDGGKITADTITAIQIAGNTITATEMVAGTITAASGILADAVIGTAKIADLAVTTAKIQNLAITNAKIEDLAVTTAKIANLAVDNAKIADLAVTNAKISNLDAAKITAGTLDAQRIGAQTISTTKLIVADFTNLLEDPSFEANSGAIPALGWDYAATNVTNVTTTPRTGARTLRIKASTAAYQAARQTNAIRVEAGEKYVFGAWIRAEGAGVTVAGGLELGVDHGTVEGTTTTQVAVAASPQVTSTYTYFSGVFTVPAGAKFIRPRVHVRSDIGNVNVYLIDDLTFYKQLPGVLIQDGAITAGSAIIADSAITNAKIADATIQHGKIVTLDASKITVGTMSGDFITAGTIKVGKLAVTDLNNLAQINEAQPGQVVFGGVSDTAVGGWSSRSSNVSASFMFRNQVGPLNFKTGDQIRVTLDAYATAATSATVAMWVYGDATLSQNLGTFALTTSGQTFTSVATVTVDTNNKTTFHVGFSDVANKTVFVRNVRIYRMNAGELLVDGSLNAFKIIGGNIQTIDQAARGVKFNSAGIQAYDNTGVQTVAIDGATGNVGITGALTATNATITGTINATAGNITGTLLLSGSSAKLKTNATASRGVEFDAAGLRAWNSAGTLKTFEIDATTGVLTATGVMNATGGTISGALLVSGSLTLSGGTIATNSFGTYHTRLSGSSIKWYRPSDLDSASAGLASIQAYAGTNGNPTLYFAANGATGALMMYKGFVNETDSIDGSYGVYLDSAKTGQLYIDNSRLSDNQKWSHKLHIPRVFPTRAAMEAEVISGENMVDMVDGGIAICRGGDDEAGVFLRKSYGWSSDIVRPEIGTFAKGALYSTKHPSWQGVILEKVGKRVHFHGTITINTSVTFTAGAAYVMGTIPVGFRPATGSQVFQPGASSPGIASWVGAYTNGNVEFALLNGGTFGTNAWILGFDLWWDTSTP